MVKLLDMKMGGFNMINMRVIKNAGFQHVTNNSSKQDISIRNELLGAMDLRTHWML